MASDSNRACMFPDINSRHASLQSVKQKYRKIDENYRFTPKLLSPDLQRTSSKLTLQKHTKESNGLFQIRKYSNQNSGQELLKILHQNSQNQRKIENYNEYYMNTMKNVKRKDGMESTGSLKNYFGFTPEQCLAESRNKKSASKLENYRRQRLFENFDVRHHSVLKMNNTKQETVAVSDSPTLALAEFRRSSSLQEHKSSHNKRIALNKQKANLLTNKNSKFMLPPKAQKLKKPKCKRNSKTINEIPLSGVESVKNSSASNISSHSTSKDESSPIKKLSNPSPFSTEAFSRALHQEKSNSTLTQAKKIILLHKKRLQQSQAQLPTQDNPKESTNLYFEKFTNRLDKYSNKGLKNMHIKLLECTATKNRNLVSNTIKNKHKKTMFGFELVDDSTDREQTPDFAINMSPVKEQNFESTFKSLAKVKAKSSCPPDSGRFDISPGRLDVPLGSTCANND